jgi:histidyl-tRNA synthetase
LRYDLTVPFAKFIALNKNKIKMPFKRYEIAKVFRDGPVKLGRDREFTQCDVDVVGISGQMIEAECLALYVSAFQKLNIDIQIQYNSRNLMTGLILESGVSEELISCTITIIDKMDKLTKDEFQNQLEKIGLKKENINNLLEYFKLSLNELKERFQDTNCLDLKKGLEELSNLSQFIEKLGICQYCVFTPTLARGQDYYTGTVFEVYEATGKLNCSIGGGGRYDKMITDFIDDGEIYPAVGISFGLTSIYEILKMNQSLEEESNFDLYIIPMGEYANFMALKLATDFRNKGLRVSIEMNQKKIKKCFEKANKENIPYVTVIGEDEIQNQKIMIKNMKSGESLEYGFDEIDKVIKDLK